ncbi:peptidase [Synechococcus phage ACG-2014d]|uniref:Peptidase n=1 Tax=Synechococcus phage ACG-2014d TaxID=1493509 RepID=A0A0E3HVZ5_9CAUD|nr:peptidase [Synechococcus phage ACG-2014d]YP_010355282.1 peptidase [Synechococcus phage ACG-2014d]AIX14724.1 peptidase [Synechococcus phage ACG-2014d]AIX14943.1 peptidase [Synechococcus phage ACG-2014d]AIX15370.1 peptidase [Synechococcus phage ACG-2014d]AIX15588.1 peptidase [Synechococcus phage ACG-2014d]AIX16018.1 peptidase [Synechococcus phage ACG-2014d]
MSPMSYDRYNSKDPMAVNTEVKGQLAKLLATENLQVEHRKITTAYFDVDRRVLALPIWKDVSGDVYDLLVGHEVGHALYTPNVDYSGAPKDFINVLEDARIERKMKVTYPGLKKSFYRGYSELHQKDFFGIANRYISDLSLIDRINLHFKIGSLVEIVFSPEEAPWVFRASNTRTFQDVLELSQDLAEWIKSKQDEKEIEQPKTRTGTATDSDTEYSPSTTEQQSFPSDSEEEMTHEEMLEEAEKREQENADLGTPSYEKWEDELDEMESITDAASVQSQQDLVDDNAKEWVYLDLPEINIDNVIVPYKEVFEDLGSFYNKEVPDSNYHEHIKRQKKFNERKYYEFYKSSTKTVNYLVKQFEMKKSADAYARAQTSRTGVIDTNSIYKYKLTDDIFKKTSVVSDGKNHGLIMYLDWSGSMNTNTNTGTLLTDTIKQTYNLIWFCKKVNIPFRVYAFTNGWGGTRRSNLMHQDSFKLENNILGICPTFELFEFFSSKMKSKELDLMMKYVWAQVWNMHRSFGVPMNPRYGLGGTPLADAVICTPDVVKKFKAIEKVQKTNVIVLSDGESNPLSYVRETTQFNYSYQTGSYAEHETYFRQDYLCHNCHKVFIVRDPKTGYSSRIKTEANYTTREIVQYFKNNTDYNWIGIRIGDKRDLNWILKNTLTYDEQQIQDKHWSKHKFCSIKNYGYTELFIYSSHNMGASTKDIDVKVKGETVTASELTRAFKKHMGSKMTNKAILNKFVEQIA